MLESICQHCVWAIEPLNNDEHVRNPGVAAVTISIANGDHFCSRIALNLREGLLHLLLVGDATLPGDPKRLRSYKARCSVGNDSIKVR